MKISRRQNTRIRQQSRTEITEPRRIPKLPTEICGLDEVLHGGIPENRTTLIKGAAGTGKTLLGLEFLYRSAAGGQPVIFVCFEETAEAVRQNARAMGWDIAALEEKGTFFLWEARIDRSTVVSGDFSIDSLLAVIKGKADQLGAATIMIDAVDVLMRIFEDPVKERNQLYRLHDWLVDRRFTTILTAKTTKQPQHAYRYEFLDYMADCVVFLDMRVTNQVTTRRLRVVKYRGSAFCSNEYPYIITAGGSVIMPITEMQLVHRPAGKRVSSGNKDLNDLLNGGFQKGSSILISGPTGSGKTTLAAGFAESACATGQKVLYISFEESQQAVIAAMLSPGIDLRPCLENDCLRFHTIMPEALVPEEHLYTILKILEEFAPEHVVVDAVSACKRMNSREAAFDFLVRLINTCRQRSITVLMTNQTEADGRNSRFSGVGVSSIIDTLIVLGFVRIERKMRRDLVVMKSRGTHHSEWHHWYLITDNGIRIDPVKTDTGAGQ
jgi:circadian clock protein KaiC